MWMILLGYVLFGLLLMDHLFPFWPLFEKLIGALVWPVALAILIGQWAKEFKGHQHSLWKAFFGLCWFFGHDHQHVIDCDVRRSFNCCTRCGHEHQYDFQKALTPDWIGFCDDVHSCPLCFGWKPRDWDRCANEICSMNPYGPVYRMPDGTFRTNPDSRPTERR